MAYTNFSGFEFRVHPSGFLIHRPHPESRARKQFLKVKFSRKNLSDVKGSMYEHVEALWAATQGEMQVGVYKARTDAVLTQCLARLPWWKGVSVPEE